MISTASATRSTRLGTSLAAVAGMLALAGCATTGTGDATRDDTGTDGGTDSSGGAVHYADGTYTAQGSYATPESVETITVTVTLKSDLVTSVKVVGQPQRPESRQFQSQFIGGISDVVVGKDIDQLSVSRVAGSSLTSGGFNRAIEEIKADAAG